MPGASVGCLCRCLAVAALLGSAATASARTAGLTIEAIEPPARYGPTFSSAEDEARDLTDGVLMQDKLWTKRSAAGWLFNTPVVITATVDNANVGKPVRLAVHAEDSPVIRAPVRIDVYARGGATERHLTTWSRELVPATRKPAWLRSDSFLAPARIGLVVHAADRVLAIDEIRLEAADEPAAPGTTVPAGKTLAEDSGARFRAAQLARFRTEDKRQLATRDVRPGLRFADAYGDYSLDELLATDKRMFDSLALGDSTWIPLAVLNPGAQPAQVELNLEMQGQPDWDLYLLPPTPAFPDAVVHDALVASVKSGLEIAPQSVLRAMIRLRSDGLAAGQHSLDVVLRGSLGEDRIQARLTRFDIAAFAGQALRAVTWGYESSLPIWKPRAAALEDLTAHGVNVNVVHPGLIPGTRDSRWHGIDAERLRRRLESYPAGTVHLLALAWDRRRTAEDAAETDAWLQRFAQWYEGADRSHRWLVYIVDEPRAEKAGLLLRIATRLKAVLPDMRLYANPLAGISGDELRALEPLIDVWQPDFKALLKHDAFFSRLERDKVWFYQNPLYGAKRTPPAFYRRHAWIAAARDLRGIGFWAYSDTQRSSAWDDFDSRRPDWAVVYEADGGIVSSRRWEAFLEGIEEHRVLNAARTRCPQHLEPLSSLDFDTPDAVLDGLLRKLVGNGCLQPGM